MHLFSLDTFIFPRIVKAVFVLGLLLIGLGMAAGIFAGVAAMGSEFTTGAFLVAVTLIGGIVSAIVWRLVVELWLVIFSINDHLEAIRKRGRSV